MNPPPPKFGRPLYDIWVDNRNLSDKAEGGGMGDGGRKLNHMRKDQ